MKLTARFRDNRFYIAVGFICLLYLCAPLLHPALTKGGDLSYHLLRIENIKDGLLQGQFPVRIGPTFLNGRGYASSLFYPELFLYFPAFLRILGFSIMTSYKIFVGVTIIVTFFSCYYCAKGITKEKNSAFIAAVVFSAGQYHLANLYVRGATGELQAFMFFPFILYGLYNLIQEEFDKPWLLGVGFWGLMFSHSISLAIALCAVFTICLLYLKKVVLNGKKFLKLLATAAVTLLANCMFWLPFVEQLLSNRFQFGYHPWTFVADNALDLVQVFSIGFVDWTYNFDLVILLLCLLWFLIPKKEENRERRKKINWLLFFGFATLFVTTKYFPWRLLQPLLNSLQFPWRFFAIATLFLAVAIGLLVMEKVPEKYYREAILAVLGLMLLGANSYFVNAKVDYTRVEDNAFTENNNMRSFEIVQKEWLPEGVDETQFFGEPEVLTEEGQSLEFQKVGKELRIAYNESAQYLDVPFLWYKGYGAVFYPSDESGQTVRLRTTGEGENGLARVYLDGASAPGTVAVRYEGTKLTHISFALNLLVWLGIAGWVIAKRRKTFHG